jgi:hypothetical protein
MENGGGEMKHFCCMIGIDENEICEAFEDCDWKRDGEVWETCAGGKKAMMWELQRICDHYGLRMPEASGEKGAQMEKDMLERERDYECGRAPDHVQSGCDGLLGHDGLPWPMTFDGQIWAKEFIQHVKDHPEIVTDEGTMIGWFANAIMVGYDRAKQEA